MQVHYRIQRFIIRTIVRSYIRLAAQGVEHIPSSGPILFAANHTSFLDPPLLGLALPRQITYLAKEELFSIPILGWWLRWVGSYPVARGKGDARIIKTALRLLKDEKALLIFPEGTRSRDGIIQPLEKGLAWLAVQSGAPIIPVYTPDTFRLMPRETRFPRPGKVVFHVGVPIFPEPSPELDREQQITELTHRVEKVLKEMEASYSAVHTPE